MPLTMSEIDFSAESGGRLGKPKRGSIEPIGVEPDGERTSGDKSFWDNIPAMDATMPSDGFYASLPILRDFTRVMDPGLFAPLPDGWLVGIADVVQSTKAIAENRYKAVNSAGAARRAPRSFRPVMPLSGNPGLARRGALIGGRSRTRGKRGCVPRRNRAHCKARGASA